MYKRLLLFGFVFLFLMFSSVNAINTNFEIESFTTNKVNNDLISYCVPDILIDNPQVKITYEQYNITLYNNSDIWIATDYETGLFDIGTRASSGSFYMNGILKTIIRNENCAVIDAYQHNGTAWELNTSLKNGITDIGTDCSSSGFESGGNYYYMYGNNAGLTHIDKWNDTEWVTDNAVRGDIPSDCINWCNYDTVRYNNTMYMIFGFSQASHLFNDFEIYILNESVLNAPFWERAPNGHFLLPLEIPRTLLYYPNFEIYYNYYSEQFEIIILKSFGTEYLGYYNNGSHWIEDNTLVSGFPSIGSNSYPKIDIIEHEGIQKALLCWDNGLCTGYEKNSTYLDSTQYNTTDSYIAHCKINDGYRTKTATSDEAPSQVTITNYCNDVVIGGNSNTSIDILFSEPNHINEISFTQDIGIKNAITDYFIVYDVSSSINNYNFTVNSTIGNKSLLTGTYNFIVTALDVENRSAESISVCTFDICINEWIPILDTCLLNNTQYRIYNDINNCVISYDLPSDNGTFTSCTYIVPLSNEDIRKEENRIIIISLIFLFSLVMLWFITKNVLFGFITTFMSIAVTLLIHSYLANGTVLIVMILTNISFLLISIFSYGSKR